MKKRFISMLDRTQKRKGGLFVALVLALTLLSGSVLAITPSSLTIPEPEESMDLRAAWTRRAQPEWLGDPYALQDGYVVSHLMRPQMATRSLTLREIQRINDLCYFYDKYGVRARQPITVGEQSDALALSTTLEAYVASVNRDERGVLDYEHYYKEGAKLPFIMLPKRELTDDELLQLIELEDACALLMPYVDEWALPENAGGAVYANRPLTRAERILQAEVEARYKADPAYRPTVSISDKPTDGVYVLGYNGGGEAVYHYPEDRAVSESEFLSMYDSWGKALAASAAQVEHERLLGAPQTAPAGGITAEQALGLIRDEYGFDGMNLLRGPLNDRADRMEGDYENATEWVIELQSQQPVGASANSYHLSVDMQTGRITKLSVADFPSVFDETSPILRQLIPNDWEAIEPDDPHWGQLARAYLRVPYLYTGEVTRLIRDARYGRSALCYEVAYADGTGARMILQAATGRLTYYERQI